MASIKKYQDRKGNTCYKIQVYLGVDPLTGKKRYTTKRGLRTKKEAQLIISRLQIDADTNGVPSKQNYSTFKDIYDLWFTQYQNTVKESTWATTKRMFRLHILPVFGEFRVKQISIAVCQNAINDWFAAGLVKYHTLLNYVSSVLDFAINMKVIKENPAKRVIIPVNKDNRSRKNLENYFDRTELEHFFECLNDDTNDPQANVFFRLAAFSGMRKSEMLCLLWSDIDFKKGTVTVSKTQSRGDNARLLVQSPKTARSNRTVYIDPKTCRILQQWKLEQQQRLLQYGFNANQGSNLVFANENNEMCQPTKPRKWLEHTLGKYDLKHVTVHAFRHTYATLAFEAGASIKSVQDQLGHSSYKTTLDIYTAVTDKEKNEATSKLANYLNF
ncbi:site-specific integrase [Levilactobacillus brevis]|uniref:Site-specific integrase n=1 Tax=Levilactobacillus hammesii TaxID=267633 RepID=A0A921F1Z0_9LACO|nr:site-specific integrase [Levilactobacillus brevis]HJE87105.1 site-specific integrase [Levilactobacillus hammesii]